MVSKKQGFTLVEMILVIVIITIFAFVMKPFFQSTKKDYLYIESCINKVYGDMNNFMYAAATSKGLGTGTNKIFPEQYTIKINNSNELTLEYKQANGTTTTYMKDYLSGMQHEYCKSGLYTSKFSGDFFSLTINKNSSATNGNTQGYILSGTSNAFTGSVSIQLCYAPTNCKEVGRIDVDTRIQMLKKRKCIAIKEPQGTCLIRDQ